MDFEEIYSMSYAMKRGSLHVRALDKFDAWDLLKGKWAPEQRLRFSFHSGSKPMDLVGTTQAVDILISEKVFSVLKENKFTGWSALPVDIYKKDKSLLKGYYVFQVTGRCGPIDNKQSKKVTFLARKPVVRPFEAWVGLYFNPETWDGSDIFSPESTAMKFVTQKVKDALERAKVTNIEFAPITKAQNYAIDWKVL